MARHMIQLLLFILLGTSLSCTVATSSTDLPAASVPPAAENITVPAKDERIAVFAGGCFWGIEAVFEHVNGVIDATSGYAGGSKETANYEAVSSGKTGHAESVEVRFNPKVVSYERLLDVFFTVAHDPTQLNYQGPDHGTQYRSAIFYTNDEQKKAALAYVDKLNMMARVKGPVVTQVVGLEAFYPAESYHQNYMKLHSNDAYIVANDAPKVAALKSTYPDLYVTK